MKYFMVKYHVAFRLKALVALLFFTFVLYLGLKGQGL